MEMIGFKKALSLLSLLAVGFMITDCNKDENEFVFPNNTFNGSVQSIQKFVTPELYTTMIDLGLNIHPGDFPPIVNGQYLASELLLQSSNIATDIINLEYAATYFTFKKQKPQNLAINMTYITDNGTESSRGNQTVISGNGNYFTVFGKQTVIEDEGSADMIVVISGRLTEEGITYFQFGLFMLDNHNVSGFIENRQGRLFYDSDNLAQKQ